jgi:hypothetical protein
MDELENGEQQESIEPTYVDLYVAAVAQEDEEALEDLLTFAALFQDMEEPQDG